MLAGARGRRSDVGNSGTSVVHGQIPLENYYRKRKGDGLLFSSTVAMSRWLRGQPF